MLKLPLLSLYIHIPWCVEKCPYCDFNSHKLQGEIPEVEYLNALIEDLSLDLHYVQGRKLSSIFIGGGTPSLLSAKGIKWLLSEIEKKIPFATDIEITLEANPGAIENQKITDFKEAGITRFSFGVQSFQQEKLTKLGRIHSTLEAKTAAIQAKEIGVKTFNLDLMHGLPDQSLDDAMLDLQTAIDLEPTHLSWYQLTIEPNTLYFSHPPKLPLDDALWEIQENGINLLKENGYLQYEISGYSKFGFECQHNLNYWRFGDYIGIGCGAHGKFTLPLENKIVRTSKIKHPKGYLDPKRAYIEQYEQVKSEDLAFEYMLNKLRLFEPVSFKDFEDHTGLQIEEIKGALDQAIQKRLVIKHDSYFTITPLGHRYLNELLTLFLE